MRERVGAREGTGANHFDFLSLILNVFSMVYLPASWPPWLVVACAVVAAAVLIWILAKTLKWFLWLLVVAALVAVAVVAARILFK
jgi:hypothetical protein